MPYHACTSPGNEDDLNDTNAPTVDYQNKMPAENDRPSNVDIIVDSVKYWNGVTPPSGTNIIAACPSGAGVLNGDQGLQVITITVKFDDNSFSLQRVVVKRASQ
jgi:hypothetical protein